MQGRTTFVSRDAVDAWDAQFRWRDGRVVRDRTIDDTWRRVAIAIAEGEGAAAALWALRFETAFRHWHLMPDPRVLRDAGTGVALAAQDICTASVNVRAFVHTGADGRPAFDAPALRRTAALAVRVADNETQLWERSLRPEARVGLLGLGPALDALGLPPASDAAADFCATAAETFALGCLRGNARLGMERGPAPTRPHALPAFPLRDDAGVIAHIAHGPQARRKLRQPVVTRMQPEPELERLAYGTADAWRATPAMQRWIDEPIGGSACHAASVASLEARA